MMSTASVVQPFNSTKPLTRPRVVPLLGPTIDHLLELRALIRQAQEQERRMTADVIRAMATMREARTLIGRTRRRSYR